MKNIILNLPTGIKKNFNKPGLYITNIIMQELSSLYNLDQIYTFNVLDSYNNREQYLNYYLENINKIGLTPTLSIIDKDFDFQTYMNILVKNGNIYSKRIKHEICKCGRIDICSNFNNPRTKLFKIENNEKICNICGSSCKVYEEESLIVSLTPNQYNIYPQRYETIFNNQICFFNTIEYIISKKRETGIKYTYNGYKYNIDVDFINYLMLSSYEAYSKTVISSNHLIRHQVLTFMINNTLRKNENYNILLHPYIINLDNTRDRYNVENYNSQYGINDLLNLLIIVSNGLRKDEYKWNHDFYKNIKTLKSKAPEKYELIKKKLNEYLLNNKKTFDFLNIENDLLQFRELVIYAYKHKWKVEEDIYEGLVEESNKKLYIKK